MEWYENEDDDDDDCNVHGIHSATSSQTDRLKTHLKTYIGKKPIQCCQSGENSNRCNLCDYTSLPLGAYVNVQNNWRWGWWLSNTNTNTNANTNTNKNANINTNTNTNKNVLYRMPDKFKFV